MKLRNQNNNIKETEGWKPGVTIGDGTVIGEGSVVTKDITAKVIAVGNPCRVMRETNK